MPTAQDGDLSTEALAAEAQQTALANQEIGVHDVTKEQDSYQTAIDLHNQQQPSFLSRVASGVGDLVTHPVDDVKQVWNGVLSGLQETEIAADQLGSHIPGWEEVPTTWAGLFGNGQGQTHAQFAEAVRSGQDILGQSKVSTDTDNSAGNLVQGVAQFIPAFLAGGAEMRALGGTDAVAGLGGTALSGALSFNPNDPRLSNLIQAHPSLANPVNAFLASSPGDSEAEGRAKNAFEQLGLAAGGELLFNAFGTILRGMRGTKAVNDFTGAVENATPTQVDMPAPRSATGEAASTPEVAPQPATGEAASTPEVAPQSATGEAAADLDAAATAPEATAEGPAAPAAAQSPAAFNADAVVQSETNRLGMELSADKKAEVLDALRDGRYADAAGALDGTHENIPWDSLSDGDNLKNLFQTVEGTMGKLIADAHGTGAVSQDTVVQLARDIGARGDNLGALQRLFSSTTGEGGLAARITASYGLMLASARQLKVLATAAHALNAETPEGAAAVLAFQKQLSMHAAIVGQVRRSSSEIGRALWAHRSLKASSESALSNIADYASTKLGPKALQDLAKSVAEDGSLENINNVADQVRGKGWKNVLKEIALNGMLSGPKTQIVNAVSVTGKLLSSVAERYIAAGIGPGVRMIARTVGQSNAEAATFREAWAHTVGAYAGLRQAWKLAAESVKDEGFVSPYSSPGTFAIQRDTAGRVGANLKFSQAVNLAGKAIRWPSRMMGVVDHFSQAVGYNADLGARSYVQAAKEADAQGLNGADRGDFMATRQAELQANPTAELHDASMAAGKYGAFLEDPQTKVGEWVSGINSVPLLKLIVAPFTHRPGNLLRQGLMDYTPLGLAVPSVRAALASGTSDASVQAARILMGTSVFLEGLHWAAQGKITGARLGGSNTESLDGIPTYSAQIGGRWYKYDRLDPVGLWLGAASDVHENWSHNYDPNDPNAMNATQMAIQTLVSTLGRVAMDKSFLKSASDVTNMLAARTPAEQRRDGGKLVTENVAKLLPFSALLNSTTQALDPTQRAGQRGSILDGVIQRIPGMSNELPPRRDLLGRPMAVVSAWNPFGSVEGSQDPMDKALGALALKVNAPPRTINGYALNANQYDEVVRSATQTPLEGGKTLEQILRQQTESDAWAHNAQAADGGVLRNGKVVQSLIDKAYQYGRDKYLYDHPDLVAQKRAEQVTKFQQSIAPPKQGAFLSGVANEPKQ